MSADTHLFTDTHCHLYDPRSDEGTAGIVASARAAGIHRMITVGCDRATSEQAIDIAAQFDNVWATVGLHPHEAKHGVSTIIDLINRPKVIAIGECGLDYYYEHSDRPAQRQAFAEQIRLANERALPLVIHTRDAWDETLDILDAEGVQQGDQRFALRTPLAGQWALGIDLPVVVDALHRLRVPKDDEWDGVRQRDRLCDEVGIAFSSTPFTVAQLDHLVGLGHKWVVVVMRLVIGFIGGRRDVRRPVD